MIARNRLIAAGVIAEEEAPYFSRTGTATLPWVASVARVGDAYSRYNSLLRELVSFEMALDRRNRTVSKD